MSEFFGSVQVSVYNDGNGTCISLGVNVRECNSGDWIYGKVFQLTPSGKVSIDPIRSRQLTCIIKPECSEIEECKLAGLQFIYVTFNSHKLSFQLT